MTANGDSIVRTAAVTGGGGGIGRAICEVLAGQGRHVAVCDIDGSAAAEVAQAIQEAGGHALAVPVDLTERVSVDAAVATVNDAFGVVEILVNAAGWDEFIPFIDTDEAFWARIVDVNYQGVLRTCHAVVPGMIEGGWGRIVNIASDAGRVGSSLESVYAGAKGAVIAFTKSLAREMARFGITANTVCPGPTDTPLIAGMAERMDGGERLVESLTRAIPMRRLASPSDVAGAVAYFTSDAASYVTGQTLSVSGGLTMA